MFGSKHNSYSVVLFLWFGNRFLAIVVDSKSHCKAKNIETLTLTTVAIETPQQLYGFPYHTVKRRYSTQLSNTQKWQKFSGFKSFFI